LLFFIKNLITTQEAQYQEPTHELGFIHQNIGY